MNNNEDYELIFYYKKPTTLKEVKQMQIDRGYWDSWYDYFIKSNNING